VQKFTQKSLKTLVIKDMATLKKTTIRQFMNANVIIVSQRVFTSLNYWPHLCASLRSIFFCRRC
jgi:hypothetical protein